LSLSYSMFSFKRLEDKISLVKTLPLPSYEEYAAFCHTSDQSQRIKEISSAELKRKLGDHENIFLIDVREPYEYEDYNIGGELIPLSELESEIEKIPKDKQVILYCKVGTRSRFAAQILQEKYDFKNIVSLAGGIESYLADS
jgi:sulfur-carrier protein adenylyltransferase/sulfurtransferase